MEEEKKNPIVEALVDGVRVWLTAILNDSDHPLTKALASVRPTEPTTLSEIKAKVRSLQDSIKEVLDDAEEAENIAGDIDSAVSDASSAISNASSSIDDVNASDLEEKTADTRRGLNNIADEIADLLSDIEEQESSTEKTAVGVQEENHA